nr:MAG TPA: hypothetical protein [Caudoviricetes sp.]
MQKIEVIHISIACNGGYTQLSTISCQLSSKAIVYN